MMYKGGNFMKAKVIKRIAKQSLMPKGLEVFIGTFIFLFFSSLLLELKIFCPDIPGIVLLILFVAFGIIYVPLDYGLTAMYIKRRNSEDVRFFDFIKLGLKEFKRAWVIVFRIIPKFIIPIICVLVSILMVGLPIYSSMDELKELWNSQPAVGEVVYIPPEDMTGLTITVNGVTYTEDGATTPEMQEKETPKDIEPAFLINFLSNALGVIAISVINIILSMVLCFIAWIISIPLTYKYRYCYVTAITTPVLTSKEVVEKTGEAMKGNKFKSFGLDFSFLLRFLFYSIISALCVSKISDAPEIVKLLVSTLFSTLCLTKYYMSHIVFFEEKS